MSPVAVVFPGQGAQQPGAGQPWIDHPAWSVVERAEAVLEADLAPLLLDLDAELSRTRESQLSVLLASLVAWEAVRGDLADAVTVYAGHSLGQITALIAAGALSFDDGLHLAAARADATQRAADAHPGGMLALLGATVDQAAQACTAAGEVWVANINAPGQVVVGGTPAGLDRVAVAAREAGVRRVRPLSVGGAFHTPLMAAAVDALGPALDATTFSPTAVPIVANHDAAPHHDGAGWPARLQAHLVQPVRWQASIDWMATAGVDHVVEIGPGTALTSLIARIAPDVRTTNVATPDQVPTVARALACGEVARATTVHARAGRGR